MRQTTPSVSVILSTFNQPAWLEKVLWGYSAQEFRDFEIVIADDGSKEPTFECIEKMRQQMDIAIHHVWHPDNGFQKCEILNHAIRCARGEYLLFSDGDCIPRNDFVAVHVAKRARGQFLSGGAVRLPLELSVAISPVDIIEGKPFSVAWLREHSRSQSLPRFNRLLRVSSRGRVADVLNRITPTRPTWNGNNASAWKIDIIAVNGMDERMAYGGEDCELGERLVNAGLIAKQMRFSAALLHLDHSRGYVREDVIRRNKEIRHETRTTGMAWTDFGLLRKDSAGSQSYLLNGKQRSKHEYSLGAGKSRMFICDSEIIRAGGHNTELASVIADAAERKGLLPIIVTHRSYVPGSPFNESSQQKPVFRFAFMRKWSLGVDGKSLRQRNLSGHVIGGTRIDRMKSRLKEVMSSTSPSSAIEMWSRDFAHWCREFQPTSRDRILLSTACDFTLLGLASALKKVSVADSLQIDLLFHLALFDGREGESSNRQAVLDEFRKQIKSSLEELKGHQIRLLATTEELARQLNQALGRDAWSKIDYPIRVQQRLRLHKPDNLNPSPTESHARKPGSDRLRLLCAGAIRKEKGRYEMSRLVESLWDNHLASGRWQLAFQSPAKRWKRLLPRVLWRRVDEFKSHQDRELFLNTAVLDTNAYQDWLRSASVGLFTYDPRRYYVRCSGVLLEMLMGGIPVIVPGGSWLSHQIRPRLDQYVDGLWSQTRKDLGESIRLSPLRAKNQWRLEVSRPAPAIMLAFKKTPDIGDCIQIRIEFGNSRPDTTQTQAKYIVEHRGQGEPKVLIALPDGIKSLNIQCNHLVQMETEIEMPEVRLWAGEFAPPESTAGLIAADLDQIPRLLLEFEKHQSHYQQTAKLDAPFWTEKHSPDRFIEELLSARLPHYSDAA